MTRLKLTPYQLPSLLCFRNDTNNKALYAHHIILFSALGTLVSSWRIILLEIHLLRWAICVHVGLLFMRESATSVLDCAMPDWNLYSTFLFAQTSSWGWIQTYWNEVSWALRKHCVDQGYLVIFFSASAIINKHFRSSI